MAVKRGIKKQEHELLSDDNIARVIALLAAEKPITKKEAYEYLNIKPNPTRLANIIAEYESKVETEKKLRAANRGKAFSDYEMRDIVESYLIGESLKEISDRLYRSSSAVKRVVEEAGIPSKVAGEDYSNFSPLPDQCVAESFEPGEYVWCSKHGAIAEVMKQVGVSNNGTESPVYQIYVYERIDPDLMKIDGKHYDMHLTNGQLRTMGGFYCAQPAYDLGSLKHLVDKYKIDVKKAIR